MRLGAFVPVCLFAASLTAATVTNVPPPAPSVPAPSAPRPRANLFHHHRSIVTDIDSRVLAALLATTADSDFDISVRAGEAGLCDAHTCSVPLTIKLPENAPPMRLAFAVSNVKGELSEVKHADCVTSQCSVQLILDRGRNTIAVGAANAMTQTAGVAIARVDANPPVSASARGRTEWF